jgi:hypothetical protein
MRPLPCLGRIFPMDDEASARLAIVKAECLRVAGVISGAEKAAVIERATVVIDQAQTCEAA